MLLDSVEGHTVLWVEMLASQEESEMENASRGNVHVPGYDGELPEG